MRTADTHGSLLTATARLQEANESVKLLADHMGVTWLVAEMLKKPRLRPINMRIHLQPESEEDVTVDMEHRLQADPHSHVDQRDLTGFGLQYCHARLCR